jgi:uncharacterized protein YeeX (DUF496 family)
MKEFYFYLLQRFNDYEVPIEMSAEEVRGLLEKFHDEYMEKK